MHYTEPQLLPVYKTVWSFNTRANLLVELKGGARGRQGEDEHYYYYYYYYYCCYYYYYYDYNNYYYYYYRGDHDYRYCCYNCDY